MGWYYELAAARSSGMAGPNAISFPEIEAWARMTGRTPDAFEIRCLTIIDGVFRQVAAKASEARRNKKK